MNEEALTGRLTWKWVGAYGALWILLTMGAEVRATADIASAIAWSIALAATYVALREKGSLFNG